MLPMTARRLQLLPVDAPLTVRPSPRIRRFRLAHITSAPSPSRRDPLAHVKRMYD
jgi:hypothetical protein